MIKNNWSSIKRQKGVSLVSLMVGMVISLMTLAAASMLFQHTYRVSNSLSIESVSDGVLSTIITELQLVTLNAGFGLVSNTEHFAVKQDGDLDSAFWRFNLHDSAASVVQCQGFREILNNAKGQIELQWVSAATCDETSALEDLTWEPEGVTTAVDKSSYSRLSFTLSSGKCWPYIDGVRENHSIFEVVASSSEDSEIEYVHQFCLVNT